jgi:hypothetical protein
MRAVSNVRREFPRKEVTEQRKYERSAAYIPGRHLGVQARDQDVPDDRTVDRRCCLRPNSARKVT